MTPEQIKPLVIRLFEFGEDKWFDYQDDFVALFAEFQKHQDSRVAELAAEIEHANTQARLVYKHSLTFEQEKRND